MELDTSVERLRASKRRWRALAFASLGGLLVVGSALALERAQGERDRQAATVALITALASQSCDVLKVECPKEGERGVKAFP